MPGPRRPGMDHDIYPYSPIVDRSRFTLPGGDKVAFFALLHLEHWELMPPNDSYRDPRFRSEFGNFFPDYRVWTQRDYGNRVGIFRVLDVLAEFGVTATVACNAMAAERYPTLIARLREAGAEPVAHNISANRMLTGTMSETEERALILDSRDRLAQAWGCQPRGWHGQDFGTTARTSRILAELGFDYTLDWPNDEQPYWHNPDKSLVAVPAQAEWDDVQTFWLRKVPIQTFPTILRDAADQLLTESTPRVLGVGLHPWMIGAPHRIRYLREALACVVGRPGVRLATAGQIAGWFRA